MEERKMLFKVYYGFSKKIMPWTKKKMKSEYFRLRNIAAEELNKHFEEWNKEFESLHITEVDNDPLKEYGGTEYCKFIQKKERLILSKINSSEATSGVFLDSDEIGDIIAVHIRGCILTVEYEPIKEIET